MRLIVRWHLAGIERIENLLPGLCRLEVLADVERDRLQIDLSLFDDGIVALEAVGFEKREVTLRKECLGWSGM